MSAPNRLHQVDHRHPSSPDHRSTAFGLTSSMAHAGFPAGDLLASSHLTPDLENPLKPQIIVMLTHNDVTVTNARDLFQASADLPVQYWGFKDVGLDVAEMERLVADFRAAGKTPVLEVVSFQEQDLVNAAELAIATGVEYFTGGSFSPAVCDRVKSAGLKYFPFCGDVGGSPIELNGTADEVTDDAARLLELGADGIDLVAFRFTNGDPGQLAKQVVHQVGGQQVIVAGSMSSVERIQRIQDVGPFGYTMGGALFEGAFAPGGSFRDNLAQLVRIDADLDGDNR